MKFLILCLLLLCACREQGPAEPTADQARQLDEAEDMLNAVAANEEGPEQSSGPSNSSD